MKILLLENHPHFVNAVKKEFLSSYHVDVVDSVSKATNLINKNNYELFMVDYDLEDTKGDEFIRLLRSMGNNSFVIAISSHDVGNNKLIEAGANAVCSKMRFREINSVIEKLFAENKR